MLPFGGSTVKNPEFQSYHIVVTTPIKTPLKSIITSMEQPPPMSVKETDCEIVEEIIPVHSIQNIIEDLENSTKTSFSDFYNTPVQIH